MEHPKCQIIHPISFEKRATHPFWVGVPFNPRVTGILNIDSTVGEIKHTNHMLFS